VKGWAKQVGQDPSPCCLEGDYGCLPSCPKEGTVPLLPGLLVLIISWWRGEACRDMTLRSRQTQT
jgi:hypothetical protein